MKNEYTISKVRTNYFGFVALNALVLIITVGVIGAIKSIDSNGAGMLIVAALLAILNIAIEMEAIHLLVAGIIMHVHIFKNKENN